jgi:DNA-binding transcriptional LysR family regulator
MGGLPVYLAARDVAAGALVRVLPQVSETRGQLSLVYPATRHPPRKLLAFRDFIVSWIAAHPL